MAVVLFWRIVVLLSRQVGSGVGEAAQGVASVATMQELVQIHRVLLLSSSLGKGVKACIGTSLSCGLDLIGLAVAGLAMTGLGVWLIVLPHSRWVHAMCLVIVLLVLVWIPTCICRGVLNELNLAAELRLRWIPGTFSKEHGEGGQNISNEGF